MPLHMLVCVLALALTVVACPETEAPQPTFDWTVVAQAPNAAFLSVHGTATDDVWIVGADDGDGPVVLHWNGVAWERKATGVRGDLWWVHAFDKDTVFFGGSNALTLRYDGQEFSRMTNPGLGKAIVFGVWGSSPSDIYAVGSAGGRNGFVWHFAGDRWRELALPSDIELDSNRDLPGLTKVWGASPEDVWVVGGRGTVLRGNARDGFVTVDAGTDSLLFTVHGGGQTVTVVGGAGQGVALDGGAELGELTNVSPEGAPLLQGLHVGSDGVTWTSGASGVLYRRDSDGWEAIDHGQDVALESLHAVWVDPEGHVWTVGGNVITSALNNGVAITSQAMATTRVEPAISGDPVCPPEAVDPHPEGSIARRWNEQLLGAIRRDTPRPTVHARNLFHTSAAMWDAWAAYQDTADGYLVRERLTGDASDVDEAVSYAAYRVLRHRYEGAVGGPVSVACFDAFMGALGYEPALTGTAGDSPSALGNRIAAAYIANFADDGSNEVNDYQDPEGWSPEQPRLIVDLPGTSSSDPTQWQQLVLAEAVTQNGIPEGSGTREYIGAHWGQVTPFAMERPAPQAPYFPGDAPPVSFDERLVEASLDVVRRTSWLDVEADALIDISPSAMGNNPLGTDDGTGHPMNPVTGQPYPSNLVLRHNFGRVLAEFWADGPDSETPPGHWNTLANKVADHPDHSRQLFGAGEPLTPLGWDVHMYLALNGAVHDAAIAAWELKREYTSARPITLIRYMGQRGQRSDPSEPSYDPEGLPLEPGLVELITESSAAPGMRHEHLARYVGEVALFSWRGEPGDRDLGVGGVGWIRAKDWVPYQRRTFVTPAFPGYVSGHSTFSRAAAEVLAELTGSPFFPGGRGSYRLEPDYLFFEAGPTEPVELVWATYFDASDQAGQSRIWGGIHVIHDDVDGRVIGSAIGQQAVALAKTFFEGSASAE